MKPISVPLVVVSNQTISLKLVVDGPAPPETSAAYPDVPDNPIPAEPANVLGPGKVKLVSPRTSIGSPGAAESASEIGPQTPCDAAVEVPAKLPSSLMVVTAAADPEAGRVALGRILPLQVAALATLVGSYAGEPKLHSLAELDEAEVKKLPVATLSPTLSIEPVNCPWLRPTLPTIAATIAKETKGHNHVPEIIKCRIRVLDRPRRSTTTPFKLTPFDTSAQTPSISAFSYQWRPMIRT